METRANLAWAKVLPVMMFNAFKVLLALGKYYPQFVTNSCWLFYKHQQLSKGNNKNKRLNKPVTSVLNT
jgi:hypothetical protein